MKFFTNYLYFSTEKTISIKKRKNLERGELKGRVNGKKGGREVDAFCYKCKGKHGKTRTNT